LCSAWALLLLLLLHCLCVMRGTPLLNMTQVCLQLSLLADVRCPLLLGEE
jgi:hypothetical protein